MSAAKAVLAADVGGTWTRLAILRVPSGGAGIAVLRKEEHASAELSGVDQVAEAFVARFVEAEPGVVVEAAVVACAGPVHAGVSRVTNLPWEVSEAALEVALGPLGVRHVRVVNDFEAMARGALLTPGAQLERLQRGEQDPRGACLVIGAGTGLGQAYVLPQADGRARVLTSEGGHVSFAPRDALERSLLAWLGARHGRVSAERVVSGLGLVNLYTFLVEEAGVASSDGVRRAVSERGAVAIAEHAEPTGDGGPDVACVQALDRFVSLFGAQAGDAALSLVPAGGVFVAGGIAPRQLARMKAGFLPAFLDKGRMRPLLERLAVSVVLAGDAGLWGAGVIAGEFG